MKNKNYYELTNSSGENKVFGAILVIIILVTKREKRKFQ